MKRILAIAILGALLCGCGRMTSPFPETTALPDATASPPTAEATTTQVSKTEAAFVPSAGEIAKAALPADWGTDDIRYMLYDYDPAADSGIVWILHDRSHTITRYAVQGLDWIYGGSLSAANATLLDESRVCFGLPYGIGPYRFGMESNDWWITCQRLNIISEDERAQCRFVPQDELTAGERCTFFTQRIDADTYEIWGGAASQLTDPVIYSAAVMKLTWDYAYATETLAIDSLNAIYRRLPATEAERADLTHGDCLYRRDGESIWRFSHYAGTGYTLDNLLTRYGVRASAELISAEYTGPSESVGAIAPRTATDAAELDALLGLLRQSSLHEAPAFTAAHFPDDASAVYVSGKHVGSLWRKITLTTKEGETIEMAHFPIASLLTWEGEVVFALSEETNRALMSYTFFMNEDELLAFYEAMEIFLNAGGRGQSPGTTAATTDPPGGTSDWMRTPLPGQPW